MTFTFYADPAHAWLKVRADLLDALGLRDRITAYSYASEDGAFAYLEEDCDAPLFIEAYSRTYGRPTIRESFTNSVSHIRRLPRWRDA